MWQNFAYIAIKQKKAVSAKVDIIDLSPISYYLIVEYQGLLSTFSCFIRIFAAGVLARFGETSLKPVKSPSLLGAWLEKSTLVAIELATRKLSATD